MADLEFLSFLTLRLQTSNRFHTPNEVSLVQKEGVPLWSHPSHHKLMADAGPCPTGSTVFECFCRTRCGCVRSSTGASRGVPLGNIFTNVAWQTDEELRAWR